MGARKVKVQVFGTIGKSILIDPQATRGATLGTDVFTPDGVVGTPVTVRAWLGLTTAAEDEAAGEGGGGVTHHRLLQGLPVGDDHPQYLRKDTLTTAGDLYVRGATAPDRLAAGSNGEVLKIVGGVPAWATDERAVVSVVGTYDEIDVDDTDPANPILSLAPDIMVAVGLAVTAVQPEEIVPLLDATVLTESDETLVFPNSRRLVEGSNITFDISTPGQLVINASGGGGSGTVDAVIGTPQEIDVDDYDPAFPVLSLAQEVLDSLDLADSAAQPGDNISIFTNDVPYLVAADIANLVPNSRQIISGGGLTGGGDLSADRTLAVGAGTGITVNADDVAVNINGLTQDATPDGATDFVMTYDASAGTLKKVLLDDLPGGGGGGTVDTIVAGDGILVDDTDPANPEVSVDEAFNFAWTGDHTWNLGTDENILFVDRSGVSEILSAIDSGASSAPLRIFASALTITRSPTGAGVLTTSGDNTILPGDNFELRFGAGGDDLAIYHDGSNNQIDSNTGTLNINDSGTLGLTVGAGFSQVPATASTPTMRFGGAFTGWGAAASTVIEGYINSSSAATRVFRLAAARTQMTGVSDATQPASMFSHYTADFGTERGYWGYPTTSSDTMILRNIAGGILLLRAAANVSRLQVDDTTGLLYTPVDGPASTEVGFRIVPQRILNTTGGVTAADSGGHLYKASGGAGETMTIPANGSVPMPIGTQITFVNNGGGTLTIAITTDTLQMSPGGATGSRTLADNGVATALKVTSTLWIIWGTGLT